LVDAIKRNDANPGREPEVIVLSPHLDDAVLSIGALIGRLVAEGRSVEVWTVFTRGPNSEYVGKDRRAFSDYLTRRAEDERALKRLGAAHHWLDFGERIWRDPPLSSVWHVFRTPASIEAFTNLPSIKNAITSLLERPGLQLYAPLAVGNHVDHVEVALAAIKASIECSALDRVCFYEDFYGLGATCRRRHFVTRTRCWRALAAPAWGSPALGFLFGFTGWSARGPGIEAYLPAASSLAWCCSAEPVGTFERLKLDALAEYRSQVEPIGGMKRLTPFIRRGHAALGGEPVWRASARP
jgi:LmbE family N-acetylglucosaminyl deacetylase